MFLFLGSLPVLPDLLFASACSAALQVLPVRQVLPVKSIKIKLDEFNLNESVELNGIKLN